MSLPAFIQWCDTTAVSVAIRDSTWLFAAIEILHLLSLAVLGGAVLIVDLRLLGRGLHKTPVAGIAADVRPWMIGSLAVIASSGALLFLSEATRCYDSPAFAIKMGLFAIAMAFTFTVRRRAIQAGGDWLLLPPGVVATLSMVLWSGVGIAGRAIGFW